MSDPFDVAGKLSSGLNLGEKLSTETQETVKKIMASGNQPENDEEFEVLDLTDRTWIRRTLGDMKNASVAKQITIGGASGWCAGYAFAKVGRAAAAAVGGSLLLIQVAHYNGYVEINWAKLKRKVSQTRKNLKTDVEKVAPAYLQETANFVRANMWMTGGFIGGFLLGIAS